MFIRRSFCNLSILLSNVFLRLFWPILISFTDETCKYILPKSCFMPRFEGLQGPTSAATLFSVSTCDLNGVDVLCLGRTIGYQTHSVIVSPRADKAVHWSAQESHSHLRVDWRSYVRVCHVYINYDVSDLLLFFRFSFLVLSINLPIQLLRDEINFETLFSPFSHIQSKIFINNPDCFKSARKT